MWDKKDPGHVVGGGRERRGSGGPAPVGARVHVKKQTGRGLRRQLEGIRVLDRDVSDAAVAVAD